MKLFTRSISALIAVAVGMSCIVTNVRAEKTDGTYVTEGDYVFAANEGKQKQIEDHFVFRDDCFMRSSYLGCNHLAELSMQVSRASASRYYKDAESDNDRNYKNITDMLDSMGFTDVEYNKYYTTQKLPHSLGVAIGRKTIKAYGKTYTLLAIVPRSAGYKQEWAGDMTTGDGDVHEGFMKARDEALRFTKKYITDNGIQGDLKIWTTGHSRGAAVANLLGGFFAAGGISYIGDDVSLSPEDVYSYSFGTPVTVKNGVSKNKFLSVEGKRGGIYSDDTEGSDYKYNGGGTINISGDEFKGIRNYNLSFDIIAMMPSSDWNISRFGTTLVLNDLGISADDMLTELGKLSQAAKKSFENGDYRNYHNKTFDVGSMSFVNDKTKGSFETMVHERINGITHLAPDSATYVNKGYQDVMASAMGLESMLRDISDYSKILDDKTSLIKPLLATYLAYACERVQAEGKAEDEVSALTLVLEDLISYITGKTIDPDNYTVDDFIVDLLTFAFEDGNKDIAEGLINDIAGVVPEDKKAFFVNTFCEFVPGYKDGDPKPDLNTVLASTLKACAYGADPDSISYNKENGILQDPDNVRSTISGIVYLAFIFSENQSYRDIAKAIYPPTDHKFSEFVNVVYPQMIKGYDNLAEYADAGLSDLLDLVFHDMIESTADIYGSDYRDHCRGHLNTIKGKIDTARELLSYMLFYSEGEEFSTEDCIKSASSFIGNVHIIPVSHDSEVYLAWIRAINKSTPDSHYIEQVTANPPTCTEDGNIEYWTLHEGEEVSYYDDSSLTTLLSDEDLIDPKTGHTPKADIVIEPGEESTCSEKGYHYEIVICDVCGEEISRETVEDPLAEHKWGEWIVTKRATVDFEGEETRTCSSCGKTETRAVPPLTPTPTSAPNPTTAPEPTGTTPTVKPTAAPSAKPTATPTLAPVKLTLNKKSATLYAVRPWL